MRNPGQSEMRVVVDQAGGILIPKAARERLGLEPGDLVEIDPGDGCIVLRPTRGAHRLTMEQGIWTLHSGEPISAATTDGLLRQIRDERDAANLNPRKIERD